MERTEEERRKKSKRAMSCPREKIQKKRRKKETLSKQMICYQVLFCCLAQCLPSL